MALLALFALATASLAPIADVGWAGWRHDHGHLTASGVIHDHLHPWDDGYHEEREVADAQGDATERTALVFTTNGEGVAGGVAAMWSAPPAGPSVRLTSVAVLADPPPTLVAHVIDVESPPPRAPDPPTRVSSENFE